MGIWPRRACSIAFDVLDSQECRLSIAEFTSLHVVTILMNSALYNKAWFLRKRSIEHGRAQPMLESGSIDKGNKFFKGTCPLEMRIRIPNVRSSFYVCLTQVLRPQETPQNASTYAFQTIHYLPFVDKTYESLFLPNKFAFPSRRSLFCA